jgi:Cadherin-like beta sandwich domain
MRKLARDWILPAAVLAVLALLAGCASSSGRGPGPLQSFALTAAANPGLHQTVVGVIDDRQEPKVISVVVPPGTAVGALVATLSLKGEAVISVVSTGTKVAQANGSTPNDFSVPVLYTIEIPGDKKAWQYTVAVRQADTEARLARLSFPEGYTLVPAFSPSVTRYAVEVPYEATSVRIELHAMSPWLKNMTVGGASSAGASAAVSVPFASGAQQPVQVETLAEDGVSHAAYQVLVRRAAPDNNAALAGLEVAAASLAPVFDPRLSGYQAEVAYSTRTVAVRAWAQSRLSTVSLVGADQGQAAGPLSITGNPSSKDGAQMDFSGVDALPLIVTVTAQDGSVRQYALNILRGEPDHNYFLGSLAVDNSQMGPVFASNVYGYRATVPFASRQVIIRARPASALASMVVEVTPPPKGAALPTVRGDISSAAGAAVDFVSGEFMGLRFAVTAEDGNTVRYNLVIVRGAPDRNADLQALAPNAGLMQPAFSPKVASYVIHLPANVEGVKLAVTAASPVAKVTVLEQPAVTAAQSQALAIPVAAGTTVVTNLTVTAEDGSQRLYRIQVVREALPQEQQPAQAPAAQTPAAQKPPVQNPPAQNPPAQNATQNPPPQKPPAQNATQNPPVQNQVAQNPAFQNAPAQGSSTSHVLVAIKNLKVPDAIQAELKSKGEGLADQARVTLRSYRTDAILQQGTAHVDTGVQGANSALSIDYRSPDIQVDPRNLVEVEIAIPTTANRVLYYVEARPVDDEMRIEPSFLLLGKSSRAAWPAPGTQVTVAGYYSIPRDDKDQRPAAVILEVSDPSTGKVLGSENINSRVHWRQGVLVSLSQQLVLPEGATVRFAAKGLAKGGAPWQTTGTARVWTVGIDPQGGQGQAVLFGIDDRAPVKQK